MGVGLIYRPRYLVQEIPKYRVVSLGGGPNPT